MGKKIVCASGYFNPLHKGHIDYLEYSKGLGDLLVVIVNNDEQAIKKHGKTFMKLEDRMVVVRALACVDMVVASIDTDRSVCKTLECIRPDIFTNGGDQLNVNIPEYETCNKLGIEMIDGLGDKIESSSWLLKEYNKE